MAKNNHFEDNEQQALFDFAAHTNALRWFHSIPNGGNRNPREARRLKRQGVKSGVHDSFLPKARGIYHGCYIEMKYGKNKLSDNQKAFAIDIATEGYCMFTCYNAGEAIEAIKMYLSLKENESISYDCQMLSHHHT